MRRLAGYRLDLAELPSERIQHRDTKKSLRQVSSAFPQGLSSNSLMLLRHFQKKQKNLECKYN